MIEEGAARDRGGISGEDDGREEADEGCVDDEKRDPRGATRGATRRARRQTRTEFDERMGDEEGDRRDDAVKDDDDERLVTDETHFSIPGGDERGVRRAQV